jgi:rhodanese-related sulfurtransferase
LDNEDPDDRVRVPPRRATGPTGGDRGPMADDGAGKDGVGHDRTPHHDEATQIAVPAQGYAGDVAPGQAWTLLAEGGELVDVRTQAEWSFVGVPDVSSLGGDVRLIEWQGFPSGQPNTHFLAELASAVPDKATPVLFLCRSGARSAAAAKAATAAGYARAYNVSDGFEGPKDADGHRGTTAGWKMEGLPWTQG